MNGHSFFFEMCQILQPGHNSDSVSQTEVSTLLEIGYDPDQMDTAQLTPLHYAARSVDYKICMNLLLAILFL